jgi:hypothetical protein
LLSNSQVNILLCQSVRRPIKRKEKKRKVKKQKEAEKEYFSYIRN